MTLIIALGIAAAVVAYVAAPFFLGIGRPEGAAAGDTDNRLRDALAEKEMLYNAIQELDFDHKSGKLSGEDHQALRAKYEQQAAIVLMRIDELTGATRIAQGSGKSKKERRRA